MPSSLATTTPAQQKLHKFLVYVPDKTDEGAFERRLAVRDQHLARGKEYVQRGFLSPSTRPLFSSSNTHPLTSFRRIEPCAGFRDSGVKIIDLVVHAV